MSAPTFDAKTLIARLPRQPGVYRMYDDAEQLIYIGKAIDLRNRVGSYFGRSQQAPKVAAMVRRVARIEYTLVNTETEALILESNLIKVHRPRYNVLLRDDKSFPYIIGLTQHRFPRLQYWRSPRRPKGQLFGPFPDAGAAKEVLLQVQKIFRIRNCRDSFFANRSRPCLQHQIGRCTAPCVGLIDAQDYARDYQGAVAVLEGRGTELDRELRAAMERAAQTRQFEQAAKLRDQLAGLQSVRARQIASAARERDADAVVLCGEPGDYAVSVLTVRDGLNLGTAQQFLSAVGEPAEVLSGFLMLYYAGRPPPAQLYINLSLDNRAALAEVLSAACGRKIALARPSRGLAAEWVEQALRNAEQALRARLRPLDAYGEAAAELQLALGLTAVPTRIDGFDISHTAGEGTVASCVSHLPEGPYKPGYRRFNIERAAAGDDYAAMAEALERYGARVQKGEWPRADLLLIDGGAAQLRAAQAGLDAAGCTALELLGISKGPDRRVGQELLHRPGGAVPLRLPPDSPGLHLLQRVRDEAHRFALHSHRRRRARRYKESILEAVPGLGPARRRALLVQFGGLQGVLRAGLADLARTPGIGANLARSLYDHLHPGVG